MAASMKAGGSKTKDKTKHAKVPEQLNLTSPLFDPLKALRSDKVFLPCPDVKPFDNLAKYESSTKLQKSTNRKSRKTNEIDSENKTSTEAVDAADKKIEVEISSQLSQIRVKSNTDLKLNVHEKSRKEKAKELDTSLHALRRKKRQRNVVTRMKDYEKGPLNFLKRCVENRHVVKVWTRSAYEWRGYCTGYLVAFDNHFNLAMMDVDETYRKPTVQDRRNEFRNKEPVGSDSPDTRGFDKASCNMDQTTSNSDQSLTVNLESGDTESSKSPETKGNLVSSPSSDLKPEEDRKMNLSAESKSSESASPIVHAGHTKSVTEYPETSVSSSITALTKLKLDDSQVVKQAVPQEKSFEKRKVELRSGKSEKHSVTTSGDKYSATNPEEKYSATNPEEKDSATIHGEKYTATNCGEKYSVTNSSEISVNKGENKDKTVDNKQGGKLLHRCAKSDTSSTSSNTENSDDESIHKDFEGKSKITGSVSKIKRRVVPLEESTKLKLHHRHVNQLFIRGDNVVSIGILYY